MRQAEADLEQSRSSQNGDHHEWACFAAHQAAEKALKALFLRLGGEAWGHTLKALVENLPASQNAPREVLGAAVLLDKHYIPARYPNGFESGAPVDFYTKEDSDRAIHAAEIIVEFGRHQVG